MRHYKHNSRVAPQGCKICLLQFNSSQTRISPYRLLDYNVQNRNENICLQPTLFGDIRLAVLFSSKNCHVSSLNIAELGEEKTVVQIQSLSLRNENDFLLKLVVSSGPEISMNFPRNSLFL